MIEIRLTRGRWRFGPDKPLARAGGFGTVYSGADCEGNEVAVKRLKITAEEAAHRELAIADYLGDREFENVIPVLDSGLDTETDRYFIVMPRAAQSLQDEIERRGLFGLVEGCDILLQIIAGLDQISNIVHRDLKPANVLFHSNRWKLADFGIAKFVEESTSLRTLRDCLTPPFAAPEQWLLESVSGATDVYAVACIAYSLFTGKPPFNGPEYKRQHLAEKPPLLKHVDPGLRSLLAMMLRKAPESRPSRARISTILRKLRRASASARHSDQTSRLLAEVGAEEAEKALQVEAEKKSEELEERRRFELATQARSVFADLASGLIEQVQSQAPVSIVKARGLEIGRGLLWKIELGSSHLEMVFTGPPKGIARDRFPRSGWDVITSGTIKVVQEEPSYHWSASLWYTNQGSMKDYRWWEMGYWQLHLTGNTRPFAPFEIADPKVADAAVAERGMGLISLAYEPRTVDDEDAADFVSRWSLILARAARGQLQRPRELPFVWGEAL